MKTELDLKTSGGVNVHISINHAGITATCIHPAYGKEVTLANMGYASRAWIENGGYHSIGAWIDDPNGTDKQIYCVLGLSKEDVAAIFAEYDRLSDLHKRKTDPVYKAKMERFEAFDVVKYHDYIKPKGGEEGTDGWIDATYRESATGETVRFVSRNVFDFGCWHFSVRRNEFEKCVDAADYTEAEKKCHAWLKEFSPFHGVRM